MSDNSSRLVPVPVGTLVKDSLFSRDLSTSEEKCTELKEAFRNKTIEAKYYNHVRISALAAIKMLTHSKQGIDKGFKKNGVPLEVMGCLVGYADVNEPGCVVVTDCFAVPCKGGPHSAEMDERTPVYMGEKADQLALTRPKQRVCGWYHSHPFDPLPGRHHCWFSDTDVTNQNLWQMGCDRSGDPFIGIVVDPQTSLQKRELYFGAFRNYPMHIEGGRTKNTCPDGTVIESDTKRQERWGSAWRSYYQLQASFFTSKSNATLLNVLTSKFGWIADLSTTPMTSEANVRRFPEEADATAKHIASASSSLAIMPGKGGGYRMQHRGKHKENGQDEKQESNLTKAAKRSGDLGGGMAEMQLMQLVKAMTFN